MPRLFDSLRVGRLELRNRIVMPPMATGLAGRRGEVTPGLIDHYVERAEGPGLVIVEHSYVDVGGRLGPRQLGVYDDRLVPGLARLADAVHGRGTPIALQINHAGRKTTSQACGRQPVAPSPIPSPEGEAPRELGSGEVRELVERFCDAARRVVEAGFDAVEVHGAHGFLLNQFVSPLSNRRSDEYGGSPEKRMRFPLQVIARIRERIGGDFPLLYRLGADDMTPGGLTIEDSKAFARRLVEAGVNLIDVSGGLCGSRPPGLSGPGYFVPQAEAIKRAVGVPVVGVGGITSPEFADEVIREGLVDLVAVGRALLEDPRWAVKALQALRA